VVGFPFKAHPSTNSVNHMSSYKGHMLFFPSLGALPIMGFCPHGLDGVFIHEFLFPWSI